MSKTPSTGSTHILIVDDEPQVRKFLRLSLQAEGYVVLEADTAEDAIDIVRTQQPDLMILDLSLPDLDGQQVIRAVRLMSSIPILVLSGRTEDSEKIAALEHGADDYMAKPFSVHDLVQRVRAAMQQQAIEMANENIESIITGNLHIHLDTTAVTRCDKPVTLEDEEYALLKLLALHGGRVMTLGSLSRALWGQDGSTQLYRNLQKRINTLRHKLEVEPSFPRYILTEPAVGYRLEMLPPE